jgi:hypothetical protein
MRRLAGALMAVVATACGGGASDRARALTLREPSRSYAFEITPSEAPPNAREDIAYKIVVNDRKTRQPIENGEGQVFATNGQGAHTWDGLSYGPEVGTYHGKLNFVIAGQWAVAIRFRRDSLAPLERVDWMQDVLPEKPLSKP